MSLGGASGGRCICLRGLFRPGRSASRKTLEDICSWASVAFFLVLFWGCFFLVGYCPETCLRGVVWERVWVISWISVKMVLC